MIVSVAIIGGGLAGVAAAVRLAEAGIAVHLIESSSSLGGRAAPIAGVGPFISGGNTNILDLLVRLDLLDTVIWLDDLPFLRAKHEPVRLRANRGLAPFHARGFFLDAAADSAMRREAAIVWKRLMRMTPAERFALRSATAQEWLAASNQSSATIEGVWRPWCEAWLRESPGQVGAEAFIQIVQEAMLPQRWGGSIGEWILPVSALTKRVTERIEAAGGEVAFDTEVRALSYDGRRVRGAVTDHRSIDASSTIVATPPDITRRLASGTLRQADRRLAGIASTDTRTWRAVTLTLPVRIIGFSRALADDPLVRWIIDADPMREEGQRLTLVLSNEHREDDVAMQAQAALVRLIPRATGLEASEVEVICAPYTVRALDTNGDPIRPSSSAGTVGVHGGGVSNLYLAGDWCETNWPHSVESAVRSGYAVAGAILGKDLVVGTLPPTLIGRLLGLRPGGQVAY